MGYSKADKFIWNANIKRLAAFNKVIFFIHIALLVTSDLYNYSNGIWKTFPSQYYVFLNHLLSLPVLAFFIYHNSRVLKKIDAILIPKLKQLLLINLLVFFPMMVIYYYWDLVDYTSSGILIIYISAVGFLFRFPKKETVYMTIYLSTFYFGLLFYVQTTYTVNPSLYLNGIGILVMYYFFSRLLYRSEYSRVKLRIDSEDKNERLELLNNSLTTTQKLVEIQNKKLKEQNSSLSNFAQIVAHDIKAPLKMIHNFSDILSKRYKSKIEEEDRQLFDYISEGSEGLTGIVDGLYDFTQISGNTSLNFEIIDLNFTIKRSLALMSQEFTVNEVYFLFKEDFPSVKGVEELLQNVFLNLFSNAIKFRNKNVESQIEISYSELKKGQLQVCVKDNGIGVPTKAQEEVFQLFRKLHLTQEYEGFGIGLATCKKIIHKHGGKIWLESKENVGTAVYFTLKIAVKKDVELLNQQIALKSEV